MNNTELFFIELLSSHINNREPKPFNDADWKALAVLSKKQNVSAIIGTQIKKLPKEYQPNGKAKSYFNQNIGKAIQEYDDKQKDYNFFIDLLNQNKINHLVVKGAVLKNLYPAKELRTNSDIDIVVDKDKFDNLKDLLLNNNFILTESNEKEIDCYYEKQYFEIKKEFETINDKTKELFQNPFSSNISTNDKFTYCLLPYYHLVYVTYHLIKHLKNGGAGVRMLMDICILVNNFDIDLDDFYLLMSNLGFEKSTKVIFTLCNKFFELDTKLDYTIDKDLESKLIYTILDGGTFGYFANDAGAVLLAKQMDNENKRNKFAPIKAFVRLFSVSKSQLMKDYNYYKKYHILLPIAYINRLIDAVFKRNKRNKNRINSMFKNQETAIMLSEIFEELKINDI